MISLLHHAACFHYNNLIRVAYCGQTMCDNNDSPATHEPLKRAANQSLTALIQCGSCFVQKQKRRALCECTKENDNAV